MIEGMLFAVLIGSVFGMGYWTGRRDKNRESKELWEMILAKHGDPRDSKNIVECDASMDHMMEVGPRDHFRNN